MIKATRQKTEDILLKAVFKGEALPTALIEKNNVITEYLATKEAFIYLGEKDKFDLEAVYALANVLSRASRVYQLDLKTFITEKVSQQELEKALYDRYLFNNAKLYSAKTEQKDETKDLIILKSEENLTCSKLLVDEVKIIVEAVNYARNLQKMPPNICNSEWLANELEKELSQYSNLKIQVLDKKAIEFEKMGLLLSVNRGSNYEARLVTVEYNGDPESTEKIALVGKGITFDSGGYNIKTGRFMSGMKYDMSGAAIAAATLKAIAQLKPKANFVAVLPITDNRVNGDASLPDSVWTSMNGKTVEINNTDAEGRLILADGITYAIRKLKATQVITIATLTGAIVAAFGTTYTGTWATDDQDWKELLVSAKEQNELIWRMPFHADFSKYIKGSEVADLRNTDFSGHGGSISAAMFLKEFVENKRFIHLDIAGTAESGDKPLGVMVRTLTQLALNKK